MPSTVTMPTPIFFLFIVLILYVVLRDDFKKPKFKSYRKRFIVHDDCEFLSAQMELEKRQEGIFELN